MEKRTWQESWKVRGPLSRRTCSSGKLQSLRPRGLSRSKDRPPGDSIKPVSAADEPNAKTGETGWIRNVVVEKGGRKKRNEGEKRIDKGS